MNLPSQLTDRLNLLEQLYEATPQGVLIVDGAGTNFGMDVSDYQRARRDVELLVGQSAHQPQTV